MMLWLLASLIPAALLALTLCSDNRQNVRKEDSKKKATLKASAGKSSRSGKKKKSTASMRSSRSSKKSGKSGKSGSKKGRSGKKSKSGKSSKSSGVTSSKSSKSARKGRSAKSQKSAKVKTNSFAAKVEKKERKTATTTSSADTPTASARTMLPPVPQIVELRAEPAELTVAQIGGLQKFNFINNSNERRVFKVKCSDNQLYRISPVFGIVEANSSAAIEVLRQNGAVKPDKLVLLTTKVPEDAAGKGAKDLLDNLSLRRDSCQMTVVPIFVDA